ncbi:MAG: FAD-dependent oxidoreductase [Bryobacteraceae bacterium]|nr:FAD-dependent oxidoreductase [Bryobacteraceae bacterium]
MRRREWIKTSVRLAGGFGAARLIGRAREWKADVAIAGGGVGGCAAALALARNGARVVMTEETDWIGGQLTQQAVPPDEHPWVEQTGTTRSYHAYRNNIRAYYRDHYALTVESLRAPEFDPGNCSVSRLCHEPRVGLAVLESMLAPWVSNGWLTILREHKPVSATVAGDRVESLTVRDLRENRTLELAADYFIDATETGDLLPMTKTEYITGAESQKQTGELHAKSEPQPGNMQAITCCFVMDHLEGENHTIDKPEEYDFWRDYVPRLTPPWPGRLLSWENTHPITLQPRTHSFDPRQTGPEGDGGLWLYRRLIDTANFAPGTYRGDVCLVNWPQNDYWLGNVIEVSEEEARRHLRRARQLSLSLFYWMQTEAPRPDGKAGWPGLRLRGDLTGTPDGLAKYPYIREARRIKAEFTVLEEHVGADQRAKITRRPKDELTAASFPDSVGVGSYRIDLHPSTGGDNYIDVSSLPFEIPLGALIPQRTENLLPAAKNLGVTHITNGCYRLHPVEWNIGEAAGLLAAWCLRPGQTPRGVRNTASRLGDFQREIERQGVQIRWPRFTAR